MNCLLTRVPASSPRQLTTRGGVVLPPRDETDLDLALPPIVKWSCGRILPHPQTDGKETGENGTLEELATILPLCLPGSPKCQHWVLTF